MYNYLEMVCDDRKVKYIHFTYSDIYDNLLFQLSRNLSYLNIFYHSVPNCPDNQRCSTEIRNEYIYAFICLVQRRRLRITLGTTGLIYVDE